MVEKEVIVDKEAIDLISKRVKESLNKDIGEWSKEVYKKLTDDVRNHLDDFRDHQDAQNARLIKYGQQLEDLAARIASVTKPRELPPEEEEEKPRAKARAKAKEEEPEAEEVEEGLEDVAVVCDHGGKGQRLGFTGKDRAEGVEFCPKCGRRIRYP